MCSMASIKRRHDPPHFSRMGRTRRSAFKEAEVMARILKPGNAITQSDDLSSEVKSTRIGDTGPVTLMIDQLVP